LLPVGIAKSKKKAFPSGGRVRVARGNVHSSCFADLEQIKKEWVLGAFFSAHQKWGNHKQSSLEKVL
jgi:hypothetical protein